jgi:hypothetical protein
LVLVEQRSIRKQVLTETSLYLMPLHPLAVVEAGVE